MKCSNTENNGSPWEWQTLGVVDPGSGGSWEWLTLGLVDCQSVTIFNIYHVSL